MARMTIGAGRDKSRGRQSYSKNLNRRGEINHNVSKFVSVPKHLLFRLKLEWQMKQLLENQDELVASVADLSPGTGILRSH